MNLLADITRLTNGRNLTEKPQLTFSHTIREERASTSLWPWLLLAVTILLPMDIAMRRVIVTRSDMQKASAWVRNRLGLRGGVGSVATSARMTQLKGAKERATATMPVVTGNPESNPEAPVVSAAPVAAPAPTVAQTATRAAESMPKPAAPVQPARPAPRPIQPAPAPDGSTLASRLMEKRRKDK